MMRYPFESLSEKKYIDNCLFIYVQSHKFDSFLLNVPLIDNV